MAGFEKLAAAAPGGSGAPIVVLVDGEPVETRDGTRIAAILLCQQEAGFRISPVSNSPRSAYCMMGECFDCLVEIDGRPNRQACLEYARDGMKICRQQTIPAGSQ